jgi:hypothetical protein
MTATKEKPSTNGKAAASGNGVATIEKVVVPQLELKTVTLQIVGTSPLIVHAWSEKAKTMMKDKQAKKASRGKPARDPQQDFRDSLYVIDPDKKNPVYGVPIIAFKAAAVSAALDVDAKKTRMRAAFHVVNGVETPQGTLVPLKYDTLVMREDMVRVGMGVADLRYRGEFKGWSVNLSVKYNARAISLEQIVSLFNAAGFGVGVCEWRPEKDGMNGMFEVGDIYDGLGH